MISSRSSSATPEVCAFPPRSITSAPEPAEITLGKPGTYVFEAVNSGNTVHALEIGGEGIEEETEEIQPGQSAELKVELKAGTYELYCPVDGHAEEGMEGELTVEEGSGGPGAY